MFLFVHNWAATWQNQQSDCATQISLGIRPVWSESSLSAWRNLGPLATHWAHGKTLIRLGGCLGWSESSLGAQSFFWFCHVAAKLLLHEKCEVKYTWSIYSNTACQCPPPPPPRTCRDLKNPNLLQNLDNRIQSFTTLTESFGVLAVLHDIDHAIKTPQHTHKFRFKKIVQYLISRASDWKLRGHLRKF